MPISRLLFADSRLVDSYSAIPDRPIFDGSIFNRPIFNKPIPDSPTPEKPFFHMDRFQIDPGTAFYHISPYPLSTCVYFPLSFACFQNLMIRKKLKMEEMDRMLKYGQEPLSSNTQSRTSHSIFHPSRIMKVPAVKLSYPELTCKLTQIIRSANFLDVHRGEGKCILGSHSRCGPEGSPARSRGLSSRELVRSLPQLI